MNSLPFTKGEREVLLPEQQPGIFCRNRTAVFTIRAIISVFTAQLFLNIAERAAGKGKRKSGQTAPVNSVVSPLLCPDISQSWPEKRRLSPWRRYTYRTGRVLPASEGKQVASPRREWLPSPAAMTIGMVSC